MRVFHMGTQQTWASDSSPTKSQMLRLDLKVDLKDLRFVTSEQ